MSKCDFEIEFDRENRTYQAGERVSGTVRLQVNKTVPCRKVVIQGFWKTHGRGNQASDKYFEQVVYEGELTEGQSYEFKFEFDSGLHPWTYRGHHLNIDHYVHVRVDVPWALDPKYETEFIVNPSLESPVDTIEVEAPLNSAKVVGTVISLVVGTTFILIGIPLTLFLGFGLIFIGIGAFLVYRVIRNTLAERKLGTVELSIEPTQVASGDLLQVQIQFTPKSSGKLNNLTLTLAGQERVVSGSGTNKTTHTHKLYEEKRVTLENFEFQAGTPVTHSEQIQLPDSNAFSVTLRDNSIRWTVQAQIDIPSWPDWSDERLVILLPNLGESTTAPANSSTRAEVEVIEEPTISRNEQEPTHTDFTENEFRPEVDISREEDKLPETATPPYDSFAAQQPETAFTSPELLQLISLLSESNRFGDERQELIDQHSEQTLDAVCNIDRVSYTYGVFDEPEYRNGQTVSGTIAGSDQRISIQLPQNENDVVAGLNTGDSLSVQGRVLKWDDLYNRIELRGTIKP